MKTGVPMKFLFIYLSFIYFLNFVFIHFYCELFKVNLI